MVTIDPYAEVNHNENLNSRSPAADAELVVGGVEDLGELQLVLRGNILKW